MSHTQQALLKCVLNCTEPQTISEQRLLFSASVPPVFSQTTITVELLVTADEIKGWINRLVKLLSPKSKAWILGPAFHPGSLVLFCYYFITIALFVMVSLRRALMHIFSLGHITALHSNHAPKFWDPGYTETANTQKELTAWAKCLWKSRNLWCSISVHLSFPRPNIFGLNQIT